MTKIPEFFNNPIDESKNSVENLLKFLFADKRDIYVDDINFLPNGGYEAWYCYTYALKQNQPQWYNQKISRQQLLDFIKEEKLNYWECFRYCHAEGCVMPFTEVITDLEAFLDEQYEDIIKQYLYHLNHI